MSSFSTAVSGFWLLARQVAREAVSHKEPPQAAMQQTRNELPVRLRRNQELGTRPSASGGQSPTAPVTDNHRSTGAPPQADPKGTPVGAFEPAKFAKPFQDGLSLDYVFVPFTSKKDIVDDVVGTLKTIPDSQVTHSVNFKCLRAVDFIKSGMFWSKKNDVTANLYGPGVTPAGGGGAA